MVECCCEYGFGGVVESVVGVVCYGVVFDEVCVCGVVGGGFEVVGIVVEVLGVDVGEFDGEVVDVVVVFGCEVIGFVVGFVVYQYYVYVYVVQFVDYGFVG